MANDLPAISNDSAALGLARLGADLGRAERTSPEALAIQAGIDATMREVIRSDTLSPAFRPTSQFPKRTRRQATPGYIDEIPKVSPSAPGSTAEKAIGALCDHYLGVGVPKKVEEP